MSAAWAKVEAAAAELAAGARVLLVGDPARAEGGDVVAVADLITPRVINATARATRSDLLLALTAERCRSLAIAPLGSAEGDRSLSFTATIDARRGIGSGSSAIDRARTIQVAADPASGPADLTAGGHVRPIAVDPEGLLGCAGRGEAAVELCRLARRPPAAVLWQVMTQEGSVARLPELTEFARRHRLPTVSIAEVVDYCRRSTPVVEKLAGARVPTLFGDFEALGYRSTVDGLEHLALVKGKVAGREKVLVHYQPECVLGDVFHSRMCDCAVRLEDSLRAIESAGHGIVLHLSRPRHGEGFLSCDGEVNMTSAEAILEDLGPASVRVLAEASHGRVR